MIEVLKIKRQGKLQGDVSARIAFTVALYGNCEPL